MSFVGKFSLFIFIVSWFNFSVLYSQPETNIKTGAKIAAYWNSMERILYAELPADTTIAIDCHQLDSAIFYFYDYIKIAKNTLPPASFKTKAVYYLLALQTQFRYIYLRNPEKNFCYKAKNFTVLNLALKIDPNNMMIKNNLLLFESEIERLEHTKTKEILKTVEQENIRQQQLLDAKIKLLHEQEAEIAFQKKIFDEQVIVLNLRKNEIEIREKKIREQRKTLTEQLSEIQTQNLILLLFLAILLLVASLAFFIYRNYRQNKKISLELDLRNKKIETAYKIIEIKNHEITDSINYALRIQNSILPTQESITASFPESFVLYKPKDIVAGDFYWFCETENRILIAAADCTGHGVPGALMSTICSEKLNEAAAKTDDVSAILHSVNIQLKKVLHQSDNSDSTNVGMDIALCSFNKKKTELEYAGANRPFWIMRNSAAQKFTISMQEGIAGVGLEETKATKSAIGGFTNDEQVFTKHIIELQKGDAVYMFTDGYVDQFGQNNKKMMTKRFREVLLSIQDKSMEEQKEHLASFIEKWKGSLEQTDDILVMGIKI